MPFPQQVCTLKRQKMQKVNQKQFHTQIINSELTYDIRKRVLWPHIKDGNYAIEPDNIATTFHLGTYFQNQIISVGTFIKETNSKFDCNPQYRLRAMATDTDYQVKGAGRNLFLTALDILKNKKIMMLWCDARLNAIPFYQALKMKSLDKVYQIPNIGPHKTMYIYLDSIK